MVCQRCYWPTMSICGALVDQNHVSQLYQHNNVKKDKEHNNHKRKGAAFSQTHAWPTNNAIRSHGWM